MITKAEYAEWIGASESDITDGEFSKILRKGQNRLETLLGYQLCPLSGLGIQFCPLVDTPEPTEEELEAIPTIKLPYRPFQRYLSVPPFLELYSVRYTDHEGLVHELEADEYLISKQVNRIEAEDWNNTIELCHPITCNLGALLRSGFRCSGNCIKVEVKAYWGLGCGDLPDESGAEEPVERECFIPDELEMVLLDFMAEADPSDKSNIKKESALSYSYEKFDKIDLDVEYADVIAKYAISKPEDYPL